MGVECGDGDAGADAYTGMTGADVVGVEAPDKIVDARLDGGEVVVDRPELGDEVEIRDLPALVRLLPLEQIGHRLSLAHRLNPLADEDAHTSDLSMRLDVLVDIC